jgi:hypothetical protein
MSIAGCFVLQLHCEFQTHRIGVPRNGQFTGETRRETMRAAAAEGWLFLKDPQRGETKKSIAMCPSCARNK